ncbi:hypothetical protein [Luteimonas sp. R10]|uniref:hypothetical protein n=1 Tax=Luteimonas sp. R10 TaxID=3108176 RepID=UPI003091951E|nr:hypothetical protein U3649_09160 [Luteimonas sp. R10]
MSFKVSVPGQKLVRPGEGVFLDTLISLQECLQCPSQAPERPIDTATRPTFDTGRRICAAIRDYRLIALLQAKALAQIFITSMKD